MSYTFPFIISLCFDFLVIRDCDEKTWRGLDRILSVWSERNIYDANQIGEFRKAIGPRKDSKAKENSQNSIASSDNIEEKSNNNNHNNSPVPDAKRLKTSHKSTSHKTNITAVPNSNARKAFEKLKASIEKSSMDENDKVVDPETLIRALQNLENSPSSDAGVRERIASLPTEVSDPTLLKKIRDKDAAERLSKQVDEACTILAEYNNQLSQELEERKRVSSMLSNYIKNQRDSLQQAESKLAEYRDRLVKVSQVRDELKSHLQNLPDLSLLPSVGLAPLPSAGDLFSIAAAKSKSSLGSTSSASPNTASPADDIGCTPKSAGTPSTPNSGNEDSHSRG